MRWVASRNSFPLFIRPWETGSKEHHIFIVVVSARDSVAWGGKILTKCSLGKVSAGKSQVTKSRRPCSVSVFELREDIDFHSDVSRQSLTRASRLQPAAKIG